MYVNGLDVRFTLSGKYTFRRSFVCFAVRLMWHLQHLCTVRV